MSRKFLFNMNGNNRGAFFRWLNAFDGEPRIAWYPSAHDDFRDLMYLHPQYAQMNPASKPEPSPPDIFLHTDYYPWKRASFFENSIIYSDKRTVVSVKSIEELPRCDLPIDDRIVDFPNENENPGRVLFMNIEIQSMVFGSFTALVLYVFVENAAFCAQRMLPLKCRLSHVVHIRFGGGMGGGGKSTGIWMLNVLRTFGCELFITDNHYGLQSGDQRIYRLYPSLTGNEDTSRFDQIRVLRSESWSGHGDVSWNLFY
ncbi:MAG: hypothetical protein HQM12_14750 [SAR324 cluster bacterium]|nr:hypothetical protein [SAR324 cluster bacterium]